MENTDKTTTHKHNNTYHTYVSGVRYIQTHLTHTHTCIHEYISQEAQMKPSEQVLMYMFVKKKHKDVEKKNTNTYAYMNQRSEIQTNTTNT